MNAFAKGCLLGVFLALGLFYGASLVHGKKAIEPVAVKTEAAVSEADFLSVKGENMLLKKMLGQVESQIILIGPVGKKSSIQGKLVWDKTMQQGFLHATGLETALGYQLVLKAKSGTEIVVMEGAGQSLWQGQFKTPRRLLDLATAEIRGRPSQKETEMIVYARGVLSEN